MSSGAAEELLGAWITLGERMQTSEDMASVLSFLRGRNGIDFSFNPPPDQIRCPQHLACLAELVAAFAEELKQEQPDRELTNLYWDRELRLRWLSWMLDLLDIIREASDPRIALASVSLEDMNLNDQRQCEINRLRARQYEMTRRGAIPDRVTATVVSDRVLDLLSQLPQSENREEEINKEYWWRMYLFEKLGDDLAALLELRSALEVEPSEEMKVDLREYEKILLEILD